MTPSNFARKDERRLRRSLAKARKKLKEQAEEIRFLGALPDPDRAPYRGIPELGGPVARKSYIDKAASSGGEGPDSEYLDFLRMFENSGNPAMRQNASKVLKGLITAP